MAYLMKKVIPELGVGWLSDKNDDNILTGYPNR